MSNKAITWAYAQSALKAGPKFTLVTLADMADQEHSCYPGIDTLADLTGYKATAIRAHVDALIDAGLIITERRHKRNGARTSDRYYLQLGDAKTVTPDSDATNSKPNAGKRDDLTPDSEAPNAGFRTPLKDEPPVEPKGEPKDESAPAVAVAPSTGERFAEPLCGVLVAALRDNGSKVPDKLTKDWLDAARLLVDRDGRDPHEARELIIWATQDVSFWQANILSMPKFRQRYDQLRLGRQRQPGTTKPSVRENADAVHEELLRRQAAEQNREISA